MVRIPSTLRLINKIRTLNSIIETRSLTLEKKVMKMTIKKLKVTIKESKQILRKEIMQETRHWRESLLILGVELQQ